MKFLDETSVENATANNIYGKNYIFELSDNDIDLFCKALEEWYYENATPNEKETILNIFNEFHYNGSENQF